MAVPNDPMAVVTVVVDGQCLQVRVDRPLVFGRSDVEDKVVGLDPGDMGISAVAGAVEYLWGVWWVHNRSAKRHLLLEEPGAVAPRRLACGDRHAITSAVLTILVTGAVLTHRLVVEAPADYVEQIRDAPTVTSGTITSDDVRLSERDREALVALLSGFLAPFPRYDPHPATYAEAATKLGPPWDHNRVRKQIERLRVRLAGLGFYIEGPRASYDLAEFMIVNRLLSPDDLSILDRGRRAVEEAT